MKRFSPASIVGRHFKTLHKEGTSKFNLIELAFFSVIPVAAAAAITRFYTLDNETTRILVTVFAVFAGLFLNLLAMIYNVFDRSFQKSAIKNNFGEDRKQKLFMFEETIHNIAFGVFVSILIVICSLTFVLFAHHDEIMRNVLNFAIHTLLLIFIFTVLMVLKRLDNLIASEVKRKLFMLDQAAAECPELIAKKTIKKKAVKKKPAKKKVVKKKS